MARGNTSPPTHNPLGAIPFHYCGYVVVAPKDAEEKAEFPVRAHGLLRSGAAKKTQKTNPLWACGERHRGAFALHDLSELRFVVDGTPLLSLPMRKIRFVFFFKKYVFLSLVESSSGRLRTHGFRAKTVRLAHRGVRFLEDHIAFCKDGMRAQQQQQQQQDVADPGRRRATMPAMGIQSRPLPKVPCDFSKRPLPKTPIELLASASTPAPVPAPSPGVNLGELRLRTVSIASLVSLPRLSNAYADNSSIEDDEDDEEEEEEGLAGPPRAPANKRRASASPTHSRARTKRFSVDADSLDDQGIYLVPTASEA